MVETGRVGTRCLVAPLVAAFILGGALACGSQLATRNAPPPEAALAIDIHTHVWNAQDLAVAGFLDQVYFHAADIDGLRYVKRPWLMLFDFPYSHLLKVWKLPEDAFRFLGKGTQLVLSVVPVGEYLTSRTRWTYDKESVVLDKLLYQRQHLLDHPGESYEPLAGTTCRWKAPALVSDLADFVLEPSGLSVFFALQRNRDRRWCNFLALHWLYPNVDLFVAAQVDFDHWLRGSAESSIEEQVDMLSKISILSEGKLLPFVAYDPRRNIEEKGRALKNVQKAILEKGFVGIKIYPPMGFRPIGNAEMDVRHFMEPREAKEIPPSRRFEFGERLDADLRALYAWAETVQVPIMAHGNESQGTRVGRKRLASPEFWARVAKEFPRLKINIGHFGGTDDLIGSRGFFGLFGKEDSKRADDIDNWAYRIISLIESLGDQGEIYTDTAMFGALVRKQSGIEYFRALERQLNGNQAVTRRLMYGSDWMMLAAVNQHRNYHGSLTAAYREVFPASADRYRGANAAEFLGLHRGDANRDRLDRFYAAARVKPAWIRKVDRLH